MLQETLRDYSGRIIGTITTDGDRVKTLRDASGRFVGKYDPLTNITIDAQGRSTRGDILMTLLSGSFR